MNKEVTLGDAIAMVFAIGSVIVAYSTLNERLTKLEEARLAQILRDQQQDLLGDTVKRDVVSRLNRIEDKIDRVIERGTQR